MTVSGVRFSVIQWTDIHDLVSSFAQSKMTVHNGKDEFAVSSVFGFRSMRSVSIALVPVRGGRTMRYRLGVPTQIQGKTYPAGTIVDRLAASVVANPESGYFYRVHWLGIEGRLFGSVLSSPWDAATGCFVSNEVGGYRTGDFLALVSEDDLASCANLHLLFDERAEAYAVEEEV